MIEVATGGGKTVFAEMCIQDVISSNGAQHVLVLVPSLALLDQWYVSFFEEFGVAVDEVAAWSGRSRPSKPALINIMVLNTARRHAERIRSSGPTMIVVDECHRAATPLNQAALAGAHPAALGMSATPIREYDDGFEKYLRPTLGDIVFRYDLNAASADGLLSVFDLVNISVPLTSSESRQYKELTRRLIRLRHSRDQEAGAEYEKILLRRRARVSALAAVRVPVCARVIDRHRALRCMIFHEDIAEAEKLLRLLRERGHSVTIYHSRIAAEVRRDNLRLYRKGAFDVLISCRALDEGVNIPETQVAIIASASASTRQRIQRLGRVLRPAPGKQHATVYTLYATEVEEQRLATEASELEGARSVSWERAAVVP